ncbi:hypothetical protein Barb4_02538 [Bacteroidales bacterium Barb4]|nr:hypothetical protein Barb4_02538 [Bacteroidales bacterium Barb4]
MNGQDAHGVLSVGDGDGLPATGLVPPLEETPQVRPFPLHELGDQVEERLCKCLPVVGEAVGKQAVDALRHFVQRQMRQLPQAFGIKNRVLYIRRTVRCPEGILCHLRGSCIVRILHIPEQGDHQADGGRTARKEGIVGNNIIAVTVGGMLLLIRQQRVGNHRPFLIFAYKYGYVFQRIAVVLQLFQQRRQAFQRTLLPRPFLFVLRDKLHPHMPVLCEEGGGNLLITLRISRNDAGRGYGKPLVIRFLQQGRGGGKERIVEGNDMPATAVVLFQRFLRHLRRGEVLAHLLVQQFPVGIAESVDALFDIAHNQV